VKVKLQANWTTYSFQSIGNCCLYNFTKVYIFSKKYMLFLYMDSFSYKKYVKYKRKYMKIKQSGGGVISIRDNKIYFDKIEIEQDKQYKIKITYQDESFSIIGMNDSDVKTKLKNAFMIRFLGKLNDNDQFKYVTQQYLSNNITFNGKRITVNNTTYITTGSVYPYYYKEFNMTKILHKDNNHVIINDIVINISNIIDLIIEPLSEIHKPIQPTSHTPSTSKPIQQNVTVKSYTNTIKNTIKNTMAK